MSLTVASRRPDGRNSRCSALRRIRSFGISSPAKERSRCTISVGPLLATALVASRPSIFQHANQFPAAEGIDIPLSREAQQFYKSGRPFLHNYLPFWVAELFGTLIVLLIPLLGVLYPMIRSLPRLYDWLMRSKITRIYVLCALDTARLTRTGPGCTVRSK